MVSFAQYFHHRTKYDPATLGKGGGAMVGPQPLPYKQYPWGVECDLKPYLGEVQPEAETQGWARLSRLLINTYGLTAKVRTWEGEPFYLRAAPSAGGLYPAEVYLVSRGTTLLPAGLYNYQVRTHSLWRYWEDHCWSALQTACFWHPALEHTHLVLVVTAVFQRSVWRYQDRAYRRICLDIGHLLGNLELAGSLCDYRPHLIGGFADGAMADLLYLDAETEGVMAIAALADLLQVEQNLPVIAPAQGQPSNPVPTPAPPDGDLLACLHRVTALPSSADIRWQTRTTGALGASPSPEAPTPLPFGVAISTTACPIAWGNPAPSLESTLLQRRSTRRFSGAALRDQELYAVLDFAYQPHHYRDQGFDGDPDYFDLSLIQTFIAVSAVVGLEDGCYSYAPTTQTLRQIRFANFRAELHYLCLGQDLGRDAAAVIFHTANLEQSLARYGDRGYRYLHLDAGHLGQRLNLAAVQLGLGVSGIGGFFDDQVNEILGIPLDEAVLYITTLGRPVP